MKRREFVRASGFTAVGGFIGYGLSSISENNTNNQSDGGSQFQNVTVNLFQTKNLKDEKGNECIKEAIDATNETFHHLSNEDIIKPTINVPSFGVSHSFNDMKSKEILSKWNDILHDEYSKNADVNLLITDVNIDNYNGYAEVPNSPEPSSSLLYRGSSLASEYDNVRNRIRKTLAHEIGHNLGLTHRHGNLQLNKIDFDVGESVQAVRTLMTTDSSVKEYDESVYGQNYPEPDEWDSIYREFSFNHMISLDDLFLIDND